jgi:hypothetical protein
MAVRAEFSPGSVNRPTLNPSYKIRLQAYIKKTEIKKSQIKIFNLALTTVKLAKIPRRNPNAQ